MMLSLGQRLRDARLQAGFKTYGDFAKWLTAHNLNAAKETVGNWERGHRRPNRSDLILILAALARVGGFDSLSDVNQLLEAGEYTLLSPGEAESHFPSLPDDAIIPHLPPQPYYRLIGRDAIVTQLGNQLTEPGGSRIVMISGLGGIGKTSLAHKVAHDVMMQPLYDDLLWQSVKSEVFISTSISRREAVTSFIEALMGYARQLELADDFIRADKVQAALQERFATGSYLIVFDNLETLEAAEYAVRELHDMVANSPRSRVLITSRKRLPDEPYLVDFHLRGLAEPDAMEFLREEATRRRAATLLDADAQLLKRVYEVTEGMPLALQLIVSQYLLGTALDLELERLEKAVNEEQLYRFIYFDLWHKLRLPARQLLVGAAAVPSSLRRSSLMAAGNLDDASFDAAVVDLVRASLLEVGYAPTVERQRYEIHAMTRWFVNSVLQKQWSSSRPSAPNDTE
jgi:transcriptional regulator with XRE-family HTH domain